MKRDQLEYTNVDVMIILKEILQKWAVKLVIGFNWLRV
jgi:hypothetical protein